MRWPGYKILILLSSQDPASGKAEQRFTHSRTYVHVRLFMCHPININCCFSRTVFIFLSVLFLLSTVDMVVQRCDGPNWLHELHDDDDISFMLLQPLLVVVISHGDDVA